MRIPLLGLSALALVGGFVPTSTADDASLRRRNEIVSPAVQLPLVFVENDEQLDRARKIGRDAECAREVPPGAQRKETDLHLVRQAGLEQSARDLARGAVPACDHDALRPVLHSLDGNALRVAPAERTLDHLPCDLLIVEKRESYRSVIAAVRSSLPSSITTTR